MRRVTIVNTSNRAGDDVEITDLSTPDHLRTTLRQGESEVFGFHSESDRFHKGAVLWPEPMGALMEKSGLPPRGGTPPLVMRAAGEGGALREIGGRPVLPVVRIEWEPLR